MPHFFYLQVGFKPLLQQFRWQNEEKPAYRPVSAMGIKHRIADWLETHWVSPAYGGGLLTALSLFFFGAATNTMVGWLYAISGVSVALLSIAAVLTVRSLQGLTLSRKPIQPVSVGDRLTLEINLENLTDQPKTLLQIQDVLPFVLTDGKPITHSIELIPPHRSYRWVYYHLATKRGVYRWSTVNLRTGAPLGLFWCRRRRQVKAAAIVYPIVLPLKFCPIIDRMGEKDALQIRSDRRASQSSTEGLTRALRPYRLGDPTRLIHWRSSARYGDLRVRELELMTGGQEVAIALDSAGQWNLEDFEQAAITAASLYFYASRHHFNVRLWTANTGLLQGHHVVLEALAATYTGEDATHERPFHLPLIWLTQNPDTLSSLPPGSRWVLWTPPQTQNVAPQRGQEEFPGLVINPENSLESQLQQIIR